MITPFLDTLRSTLGLKSLTIETTATVDLTRGNLSLAPMWEVTKVTLERETGEKTTLEKTSCTPPGS
jgi:hypothetical protein